MALTVNDMNTKLYPNYQFHVYIKNDKVAFSKISNIEQEQEIEEFVVGGMNRSPHIAAVPSKKGGRLILEHGVVLKNDNISKWKAGYYIKDQIDIFVFNNNTKKVFAKHYHISGGMIVKWELGTLDGMGSEILIQKFEIAHNGLKIDK